MITDIDYYFDPPTWIIPQRIFGVRKNSGLKIRVDFLDPGSHRFWGNSYYENWDTLGIQDGKDLIRINIETSNLLKAIQYSGISELGYLNGTYKIVRMKWKVSEVYRLIPEDSRENLFKSEISEKYYNPNIPFTCKMIPGHLYVSRSGHLYICLKNKSLNYSFHLGLTSGDPRPQKVMMFLDINGKRELDRTSPKSFQEFMKKVNFQPNLGLFSYEFSGKDLGELFPPGELTNYLTTPEIVSSLSNEILLSNEVWKTNSLVRDELKKRLDKEKKIIPFLL